MRGYAPNPVYKNQSFSGKVWPVSPVENRNPYRKVADLYEYKERPASRICWLS
ncbi:hypothetical protein ERICI_03076 [Paenibacillus larvae subsp. larvae]|uniref:Uncharacterized protein n=2 Tax=Paenibacillus larvae subsp. larvae TaxID=147375 RepID=V9WAV6_9BACL|nr:hypothetical protein ERIC2_c30650 [Paenibacillus larvae subsp. larvae DSM 25430]AVF22884.1 hypothetical protein ERICI_03076 [Paenibacillus larvae subsp. larvae]ETK26458.1 hypothetical protein ERIC1_2c06800 [Paenibacillus larvae subsp. larvae DSM 25719]AVF28023.1 hypothetical protein ERICIII_03919 [Paenibacillus larvae subsp. larvae]AVF32526.1 hypothetical protein ERICIV_03662 [Paenibacillus larvae subsp. larvae]